MPLWTAVPAAAGMTGADQLVIDQAGTFAIASADQVRAALDSPVLLAPSPGVSVPSPALTLRAYNSAGNPFDAQIQHLTSGGDTYLEIKQVTGGAKLYLFSNGVFLWETGSGFTELRTILRSVWNGAVYLDTIGAGNPAARSRAASGQTANVHEFVDNTNAVMSAVGPAGEWRPASLADSAAANNSVYYSTTANKLVYKDAGGTVNNLY